MTTSQNIAGPSPARGRLLAGALPFLLATLTVALLAPVAAAEPAPAPGWSPIAVTGPTNVPPLSSEIQTVAVDAEGGTFTLSFAGQTTDPIPFDAQPTSVEAELDGLASIGAAGGDVSVVGGSGGKGAEHRYAITFAGSLADTDVAEMTSNAGALLGGSQTATVTTAVSGGPGTATIAIYAQNIGGAGTFGLVTEKLELPAGLTTAGPASGTGWTCPAAAGLSSLTCTSSASVGPSLTIDPVLVPVRTVRQTPATEVARVSISGGGAQEATYDEPITTSAIPAQPGFQAFRAAAYDADGKVSTQAGAHPYTGSAAIFVNTKVAPTGNVVPAGEPKDIRVDLPPGFIGNPTAVPACPENCSFVAKPVLGIAQPILKAFGSPGGATTVMNIEKPFGYPSRFDFILLAERVSVLGSLRSDEDYGISVESPHTAQIYPVFGSFFTFWGAPEDPAHDDQRCAVLENHASCGPAVSENTALLTNPTNCAEEAASPPITSLSLNTWLTPDVYTHTFEPLPPVTGCDKLHFEGKLTFQPDQAAAADSPAGFQTEITVPEEGLTDPSKLTTPELKKTVVELPQGVALSPSAATGLGSCSEAQIGLKGVNFPEPNRIRFSKDAPRCPDSSKIGTVSLRSALLDETLYGSLYLAAQGDGNPFGSTFAVYLVIDDPASGIIIKLPGEVQADARTGQLKSIFDDNPQLPFTTLKLNFKGGSRSPMATPTSCGIYTTRTEFTPWSAPESGPPFETRDSFPVNSGPGGTACANTLAQRPFNLGMSAGSANPIAGAHTPFSIRVTRPDGAQEVSTLEITPPAGFTASLRGVPYCPDAVIAAAGQRTGRAEQASPSCPAASQVGTTQVGAGAGPNPFYTPGRLYLAGPYKGAPLSVVSITPAVAGPFDLGNVVVRAALFVNPETAQITAKSDPLPEYLKGVQLRIRDIRINLDRPNWALNPTSCDASSVDLTIHGTSGATARPANRFQVGGCRGLGFKPHLRIRLKGGTKRNKYPALIATLTQPPSQANIRFAQVALPHSEFLEQGHIRTICTRVQFAAKQCPAASIYGHARAETPLLGYPLSGPVYLRSSDHKLPDLVAVLRGPAWQPIEIDLDGRVDSVRGGIRTTFEVVPDAPVSKFVLRMKGGKKGLLVNSTNICRKKHRATVRLIGHNNKVSKQHPKIKPQCRRHSRKHHGDHRRQGEKHQRQAHKGAKGEDHRPLLARLRLPF